MNDARLTYVLLAVNLLFVVTGSLWLAGDLARLHGTTRTKWLFYLWGIYLVECFAFSAGMATNVGSFAMAVIWGFVFPRWVIAAPSRPLLIHLSLYTTLPAVSFLSVFVVMLVGGWPVFTPEGGYKFGVPDFIPWPFCTVAGFFAAIVGSAVIGKTVITTFIALRRLPRV